MKLGWVALGVTTLMVGAQALVPQYIRFTFPFFLLANVLWFVDAYRLKNKPQMALQALDSVFNIIACYRWL